MRLLPIAGAVLLVAVAAPSAQAQCSCVETTNPSFTRTLLTAYAGEFEALVVADTLRRGGQSPNDLRAIARLFRRAETLVRKGQVLQIAGKFPQAESRFLGALETADRLGALVSAAAQAGQLATEPGDRLDDRHAALTVELGRISGDLGSGTCYGQCQEVCGDDGGCHGLAYRCQCMWNACYPTCSVIS